MPHFAAVTSDLSSEAGQTARNCAMEDLPGLASEPGVGKRPHRQESAAWRPKADLAKRARGNDSLLRHQTN